jgi:signal transduction histidine kinase
MTTILDQSIETVRRISWELTPQVFKEAGLSNTVRRLCERLNGKGQEIEFSNNSDVLWNNDSGLNAYRIVQELLNNAIKHSGADKIFVRLDWRMDTLEIQIEDNGKGFELENAREGVGWWNVTQRANQLKAKIHIGKPPMGTGSTITLTIPLEHGNT